LFYRVKLASDTSGKRLYVEGMLAETYADTLFDLPSVALSKSDDDNAGNKSDSDF
jgi:hypothetical protein